MDNINTYNIEFIDLSDVEETERNWIISSLHSWDPNVRVPWQRSHCQPPTKRAVPLHVSNNLQADAKRSLPPNMVLHANINVAERNNFNTVEQQQQQQQMHPMYHVTSAYPPFVHNNANAPVPYQKQTRYSQDAYVGGGADSSVNMAATYSKQIPQTSQNVIATLVVNSDINYAFNSDKSKTYINTKVEITQDYSNRIEGKPVSNGGPFRSDTCVGNVELSEVVPGARSVVSPNRSENVESTDRESAPKSVFTENVRKSTGKSWASLFNASGNADTEQKRERVEVTTTKPLAMVSPFVQNAYDNNIVNNDESGKNVTSDLKSNFDDPVYHILGEYLCEYSLDHRTISLQPRGLINRSNYCYINSILQALLACPPVYNLLSGLSEKVTTNEMRKQIPVIDHMAKFVQEFQHLPAGQRVSRRADKNQKQDPNTIINCDTPFEPGYIYKMLNGMRSDTFVVEGRQEDAEEFLGCLLNGLNDEMLELMKLVGQKVSKLVTEVISVEGDLEDKEWQVMGPKNKGCVTRRTEVIQTPISDIFNGHLRSRVHRTGDKSTDNIQPFFTLQLNIEKVSTVREALEALVCRNQLEGVTSSRTNEEVEAWQQVTIEDLPYVLILHLKCFDFKLDGCTKIVKALEFPVDLKIDGKLLSSKTNYTPKEKQYKLFAVVYHDGKEATKGHYITDAYHVGYGRWVRYDDASVKAVPEEQVLKPHGTKVPYLLFYRRSDSIRNK